MRKIIRKIKDIIKSNKRLYKFIINALSEYGYLKLKLNTIIRGDKYMISHRYKQIFGRETDFKNPKALTEKIQWLKVYGFEDFHTVVTDKYAASDWLAERFGSEYLIPLLFKTNNYKDIKPENIPEFPCIIKPNNGSGSIHIVRDKNLADWDIIRESLKLSAKHNYYYYGNERQYKNIKPLFIAEKLLQTKAGKIPNDYKLHFINGKLEFVYCTIDREGANYRKNYTPDWQPLPFDWSSPNPDKSKIKTGPDIPPPASYSKMREIGSEIAKLFKYIRVDFYDVDGRLYYGEVTIHHGSGYDVFIPEKYDYIYGEKLKLN